MIIKDDFLSTGTGSENRDINLPYPGYITHIEIYSDDMIRTFVYLYNAAGQDINLDPEMEPATLLDGTHLSYRGNPIKIDEYGYYLRVSWGGGDKSAGDSCEIGIIFDSTGKGGGK